MPLNDQNKVDYFKKINLYENLEAQFFPRPGTIWLTPMLYVTNVKTATELYKKIFGFIPTMLSKDEKGDLIFSRLRYRGSNFMLLKEGFGFSAKSPKSSDNLPSFIFYLYVDDMKKTLKLALSNNCKLLIESHTTYWGDTQARIEDPFGYIWDIATIENTL